MNTDHRHFSPAEAREAARVLLAELPLTEDRRASMDDFWIGRLRTALADLLDAEPITLGDCGDMIRQALAARARLLGETSEPVPLPFGPERNVSLRCDAGHPSLGATCTRTAGHAGFHVEHGTGGKVAAYWPRRDGGSEDLDAALGPDAPYSMPVPMDRAVGQR